MGLIQTAKQPTVNWVHGTPRPLTLFGDVGWRDVIVRTTALILEESTIKETTIAPNGLSSDKVASTPGGGSAVSPCPCSSVSRSLADAAVDSRDFLFTECYYFY